MNSKFPSPPQNKRRLLINGFVLVGVIVLLAVNFTVNASWNTGVIVVLIILAATAALQFGLYKFL